MKWKKGNMTVAVLTNQTYETKTVLCLKGFESKKVVNHWIIQWIIDWIRWRDNKSTTIVIID